jgi:hypothetical protein
VKGVKGVPQTQPEVAVPVELARPVVLPYHNGSTPVLLFVWPVLRYGVRGGDPGLLAAMRTYGESEWTLSPSVC